jgi:hypothetical protein
LNGLKQVLPGLTQVLPSLDQALLSLAKPLTSLAQALPYLVQALIDSLKYNILLLLILRSIAHGKAMQSWVMLE